MSELQTLTAKVNQALDRLDHLEKLLEGPETRWRYLVSRSHPWRKQLCLKGRNMTVGQLLSVIHANGLSPEQAAADLDLPLDAVQEAMAYESENRRLIELEAREERRRLIERGHSLEPKDLPR